MRIILMRVVVQIHWNVSSVQKLLNSLKHCEWLTENQYSFDSAETSYM